MSKTPLYKMLQDVPSSGGWTLATLLDGSVSGSQLLLQAGKPVWQAGPSLTTSTTRASPSQSAVMDTTCCTLPLVSPLRQSS